MLQEELQLQYNLCLQEKVALEHKQSESFVELQMNKTSCSE